LRGYGKLVIIKHNANFLSAYAYNKHIFVIEGQEIIAGQKIATMGRDNSGRIDLHFEIRLNGKPVNPLHYLGEKFGTN
jgi:lipoprotein NlpD